MEPGAPSEARLAKTDRSRRGRAWRRVAARAAPRPRRAAAAAASARRDPPELTDVHLPRDVRRRPRATDRLPGPAQRPRPRRRRRGQLRRRRRRPGRGRRRPRSAREHGRGQGARRGRDRHGPRRRLRHRGRDPADAAAQDRRRRPDPDGGDFKLTAAEATPHRAFYDGKRAPRRHLHLPAATRRPTSGSRSSTATPRRSSRPASSTAPSRTRRNVGDLGRARRATARRRRRRLQVPRSAARRRRDGRRPATRGFGYHPLPLPAAAKHTYGDGFGAGRGHQGQDVLAKCGTPLLAARGGRVQSNDVQSAAGNYLVIDGKGTGVDSIYMHLPAARRFGGRPGAHRPADRHRRPDRQRPRLPPALRDLVGARLVRGRPPDADRSAAAEELGRLELTGADAASRSRSSRRSRRCAAGRRRPPAAKPTGAGFELARRHACSRGPSTSTASGRRRLRFSFDAEPAARPRGPRRPRRRRRRGPPLGRARPAPGKFHRRPLGRPPRRPRRARPTAPTSSGSARPATAAPPPGASSFTTTSSRSPARTPTATASASRAAAAASTRARTCPPPAGRRWSRRAAAGSRRPATATRSTATTSLIDGTATDADYFYAHMEAPTPLSRGRPGSHRRARSARSARPATRAMSSASFTSSSGRTATTTALPSDPARRSLQAWDAFS